MAENKMKRKHLIYVDVLNIMSCFAVVMLHVSLNVFNPSDAYWTQSVLFQSIAIFAVPIFFMISGMNLIGYADKYDTKTFFKKRLWRVGRALILASVFCYILFCIFPFSFYGAEQYASGIGVGDFVSRFLTNSINDIYWFLYTIIYLYMLTPLLTQIRNDKNILQYLIVLQFSISILIPLIERLGVSKKYFGTIFNWPLFSSSALLYFLLGFYIANYLRKFPPLWLTGIICVISVGAMFFGGLYTNGYFAVRDIEYHSYVISTSSPLCVVEAVSLFLCAMQVEQRLQEMPPTVSHCIREISGASLGVYLFHILVINWMGKRNWGNASQFWGEHMGVRAIAVYLVTLIVVVTCRHILMQIKKVFTNRRLDRVA